MERKKTDEVIFKTVVRISYIQSPLFRRTRGVNLEFAFFFSPQISRKKLAEIRRRSSSSSSVIRTWWLQKVKLPRQLFPWWRKKSSWWINTWQRVYNDCRRAETRTHRRCAIKIIVKNYPLSSAERITRVGDEERRPRPRIHMVSGVECPFHRGVEDGAFIP